MDKCRLSTCFYLYFTMLIISSQGQPTWAQYQEVSSTTNAHNLLPPVKKDVFMSRGWGASGMPFTMLYLNRYAKAQKAYAENQQQLQKLRQQEIAESSLRASEDQFGAEQPRTLPYGTRYLKPLESAQESEMGQNGFKEEEYTDNGGYLPAKPSSPRRQYNVPQLFVSYGWGPMG